MSAASLATPQNSFLKKKLTILSAISGAANADNPELRPAAERRLFPSTFERDCLKPSSSPTLNPKTKKKNSISITTIVTCRKYI